MKFATIRPYGAPEAAARNLIELANAVEAVQHGRIHIELLNGPMLFDLKATPAEYSAGLKFAIERGCRMHESGTYVKFTQTGAEWCLPSCSSISRVKAASRSFVSVSTASFAKRRACASPCSNSLRLLLSVIPSLFISDGDQVRMFI
jgi:hypothetical protein